MSTKDEIEKLIADLHSKEGNVREHARNRIVEIGRPAVPFLIELLDNSNHHMRWEACKALGAIPDPSTAAALANLLSDESIEIRWLAAEALIALKRHALPPLLRILQSKFESPYVREGAHHILYALQREKLLTKDTKAVLEALSYLKPKGSAAAAAHHALHSVTHHP